MESSSPLPPVPDSFVCVITKELMEDPVMLSDGHTYERNAIETWLQPPRGIDEETRLPLPPKSPMTGLPLSSVLLTSNVALRKAIAAWVEIYPNLRVKPSQMSPEDVRVAVEGLMEEATTKKREKERIIEGLTRENEQLKSEVQTLKREKEEAATAGGGGGSGGTSGLKRKRVEVATETEEPERWHDGLEPEEITPFSRRIIQLLLEGWRSGYEMLVNKNVDRIDRKAGEHFLRSQFFRRAVTGLDLDLLLNFERIETFYSRAFNGKWSKQDRMLFVSKCRELYDVAVETGAIPKEEEYEMMILDEMMKLEEENSTSKS